LKSDLDVLYYRISEDKSRPLLNNENPRGVLETLLRKREENFLKAHFIVDTSEIQKEEITFPQRKTFSQKLGIYLLKVALIM
jgi:shikimate kinase